MNAATSPVCAPSSGSVEQSCAATPMFDPSSRSATVFSDVNTGAITTSQWLALATRDFRASAVSTDSPAVLYIFQFPAITGLRIICQLFVVSCLVVPDSSSLRFIESCPTIHVPRTPDHERWLSVVQGSNTR